MKREKDFREHLKDKCMDLTSCIKKYEDHNPRITEVLDALEEPGMSYRAASSVADGKVEVLAIQISNRGKDRETMDCDAFVEKYGEHDREYEPEHCIRDDNGNMVRVEPVCAGAGKDMVITWKDTNTGKIYKTTE